MTKEDVRQREVDVSFEPFVSSFEAFIEMEDLLSSFREPCIMDCKIGVRTYLEEDLEKSERDPEPRAVREKTHSC